MRNDGPVFGLGTAITSTTIGPAELGRWIEANGFESLWFGEHSHVPTGQRSLRPQYTETPAAYRDLYDPLLSLVDVANATSTLKLGTSILILPEHHPIRLAKMLATLDRLSGGRVILGIGAGWSAEEMADYGVEFKDRWKYTRECVLAMREIWNNEVAEFSGDFIRFEPMWSGPEPIRKGGPPVAMGAWNKFAIPRIVEYCDGWVPVDQGEGMDGLVADLREACARADKSFDDLDMSVVMDPLASFAMPDDIEKRVGELHRMGFGRILFTFLQDTPDNQWKNLERLHKVVRAFA